MEYCRALKFEEEPDYKKCIGFFDNCSKRHNFDVSIKDFTWKQNRLSKDKEALKMQMMTVLKKGNEKPTQAGVAATATAKKDSNN
jgi:hypothetical protein